MKKFVLAFITLALVLLTGAYSWANVSLDRMYVNANTLDASENLTGRTLVQIAPGDRMYILGWAAKNNTNLDYVCYTVDGTVKYCDGTNSYNDRSDVAAVMGFDPAFVKRSSIGSNGAMMELIGINLLDVGMYDIEIIAKYQDGTEELAKSFSLLVGEKGDLNYIVVSGNNDPFDNAVWLTMNGQYAAVEFTTSVPFYSIFCDVTWASRKDEGRPATVVLSLYRFLYNPEYSMDLEPVATYTYDTIGDGDPLCTLSLLEKAPAGTYIFKIMTAGEYMTGNPGDGGAYLVLDGAEPGVNTDKVRYLYDFGAFRFGINCDKATGDTILANPEDTYVPYEEIFVPGDVDRDGEVTDWDAITLDRYLSSWYVFINEAAADVDGDGDVNDWDAIILSRYLAGWNIVLG